MDKKITAEQRRVENTSQYNMESIQTPTKGGATGIISQNGRQDGTGADGFGCVGGGEPVRISRQGSRVCREDGANIIRAGCNTYPPVKNYQTPRPFFAKKHNFAIYFPDRNKNRVETI